MMNKDVSHKISLMNFVFTIGIVLYHFRWVYTFNLKYINSFDEKFTNLFLKICDIFGYLSMTFFFLISGFLFYYNANKKNDTFEKMKRRIKSLLIPYLLWFLITLIYLLINNKIEVHSFKDFIDNIFLNPINGPMWYCLALLILMIPSPVIIRLKNKKILATFFLCTIVLISSLMSIGIINPIIDENKCWWLINMNKYLPSYALGAYLGLVFPKYIVKSKKNKKCPIQKYILSCAISIVFIFLSLKVDIWPIKQIFYIIAIISMWFLFELKIIKKIKFPNISFFLYSMHQPILIPEVNRLIFTIIGNSIICGYIFIMLKIFGILLMILFCYFVIYILKKIKCKKTLYYLSGGRV